MTKEEAIQSAGRFLTHIYEDNVFICSRICSDVKDGNVKGLSESLDVIIEICNKWKKEMRNEQD